LPSPPLLRLGVRRGLSALAGAPYLNRLKRHRQEATRFGLPCVILAKRIGCPCLHKSEAKRQSIGILRWKQFFDFLEIELSTHKLRTRFYANVHFIVVAGGSGFGY
jgi:hypothetical protein